MNNMASVPFVIERRLQYHGIWNAGYNIGDLFYKNVSREFAKKRPYPALLRLSSGSLALTVFRSGTQPLQEIRTDAIPFDAIRDIAANGFNPRCIMVIYVNNKNKLSVIVGSCREGKETLDIAAAFKQLRAMTQARRAETPERNSNWVMRQNSNTNNNNNNNNNKHLSGLFNGSIGSGTDESDGHKYNDVDNSSSSSSSGGVDKNDNDVDESTQALRQVYGYDVDASSIKSRTDSRVCADNFEFLDDHDGSFEDEDEENASVFHDAVTLDREEGPADNVFNVGLQAYIRYRPERLSVSSLDSFQDMKDEVDSIDQGTAISQTEYSKKCIPEENGSYQDQYATANGDGDFPHINDGKTDEGKNSELNGTEEEYDYRAVGSQTEPEPSLGRTRYTKRPGSLGTSNAYREMAAQRKSKNGKPVTFGHAASARSSSSQESRQRPGSQIVPGDNRGGAVPIQSLFLPRNVRIANPSTTVSRPIENVYHGHRSHQQSQTLGRRGHTSSRKRRVLVMSTGRSSLRI